MKEITQGSVPGLSSVLTGLFEGNMDQMKINMSYSFLLYGSILFYHRVLYLFYICDYYYYEAGEIKR